MNTLCGNINIILDLLVIRIKKKKIWVCMHVKYVQLYWLLQNCLIDQYKPKVQFVRISVDSPTFDRIKKDKSAKIVDKLSAIGGTMGLLTGFSIISAVEIIFYLAKLFRFCTSKFKCILK